MPLTSIIIISYNTAEMTVACLRSIFAETKAAPFEVIVLDNASTDGSPDRIAEEFRDVRLIRSEKNIGFAAGNNEAAKAAKGDLLLLLNPDTVILDAAIDKLVARAAARPGYGAWGGRTLFGDRSLNPTAGWNRATPWSLTCLGLGLSALFRRSRVFNPESLASWAWDSPRDVDVITGCMLLIRTELWRRLEGFDTQFFMYGEDADLCYRVWEAGYRCELFPEATIIHYGGASERKRADKMCRLLAAQARIYRKHMGALSAGYCVAMLRLWAFTRTLAHAALSVGLSRSRESFRMWSEVLRNSPSWSKGEFVR
jgi:N-acetylglucosaminyl-diphospho-decaprenol L-rhamnosyltransferase